MRKSAVSHIGSGKFNSDKVYSTTNLEVSGKIKPLSVPGKFRNPKTKTAKPCFEKSHFFIQKPKETAKIQPQSTECSSCSKNKNVLNTAVKEYTNNEVSNKLLRQIREASQAADFEGILRNLCQGNIVQSRQGCILNKYAKRDKVLDRLDREELYEEFFGKHFDNLASIVVRAKQAPYNADSDV